MKAQRLRQHLRFPSDLPHRTIREDREAAARRRELVRAVRRVARERGDVYGYVFAHTREQLAAAGKSEAFLRAWDEALRRGH